MRWKSVKVASEVILEGVKIAFEKHDNQITAVILKDAKGGLFRLTKGDYNGMAVFVPAPPETEKKWVLSGAVKRVPVREVFDDEEAAVARIVELSGEGADLGVEAQDVPVEAKEDDIIPF
jgi:hypothetical protein